MDFALGATGHGGGDGGIIADLYKYLTDEIDASEVSEIGVSVKNHMMAFAAEDSRKNDTVVELDSYTNKYMKYLKRIGFSKDKIDSVPKNSKCLVRR